MYQLHEIEGALELSSSEPPVFKPSELYRLDQNIRESLSRYQLYIVARRPRLSLIVDSFSVDCDGKVISGTVMAQTSRTEFEKFELRFALPFQAKKVRVGESPFEMLWIEPFDSSELQEVGVRLFDILRLNEAVNPKYTDMFVEYIGRSYGEEGERSAVDRLIGKTGKDGHGSLQSVLADVNDMRPDQEVHVLLFSYEFHKRHVVGGYSPYKPEMSMDDAPDRLDRFMSEPIDRNDRIKLAEASLIRYFQPHYNVKYKSTFPDCSHKILERMWELDITGIVVSLTTLGLAVRLYSDIAPPSFGHLTFYPIVKEKDRASFFDVTL